MKHLCEKMMRYLKSQPLDDDSDEAEVNFLNERRQSTLYQPFERKEIDPEEQTRTTLEKLQTFADKTGDELQAEYSLMFARLLRIESKHILTAFDNPLELSNIDTRIDSYLKQLPHHDRIGPPYKKLYDDFKWLQQSIEELSHVTFEATNESETRFERR